MVIYRKADAWIIAKLNDLYLWSLDWTGVYIGTITFLVGAEQVAYWISRDKMWFAAFMLFLMLVNAGLRYYQQAMEQIALYNAGAEWFEKSILRHMLVAFGFGTIIGEGITGHWVSLLDSCATQFLLYLWCIKIRERQKKDFKLPVMATQRST